MAWYNFITNGFRRIERKEAPMVMYQSGYNLKERNYDYKKIAKEGYQENAIVFRCVNEIAHGASAVDLCVYQGDVKLDQHPLIDLLKDLILSLQEMNIFKLYTHFCFYLVTPMPFTAL